MRNSRAQGRGQAAREMHRDLAETLRPVLPASPRGGPISRERQMRGEAQMETRGSPEAREYGQGDTSYGSRHYPLRPSPGGRPRRTATWIGDGVHAETQEGSAS